MPGILKRVACLLGAFFVLGAVVLLARPACACLPPVYEEVRPDSVPGSVLHTARQTAPGLVPVRAWTIGVGSGEHALRLGYLLRGKRPGAWFSEDVKVEQPELNEGPADLQPVE